MRKKYIGIASIPARESSIRGVVDSVREQVDEVFIALNGYQSIPKSLLNLCNVKCELMDNSLGDAAKFYWASIPDSVYFAGDDDLLYPMGYVDYLISGIDKYNALVSLHGKTYVPPVTNFKRWSGNYRVLNTVSADVRVNVVGSGCCAFDTNRLKVDVSEFKLPNMADIWLSKIAAEQGVPIMVLKHNTGYVRYLPPPDGKTIWGNTKDYSPHVSVLRTFI